jgi:hypothetical protein
MVEVFFIWRADREARTMKTITAAAAKQLGKFLAKDFREIFGSALLSSVANYSKRCRRISTWSGERSVVGPNLLRECRLTSFAKAEIERLMMSAALDGIVMERPVGLRCENKAERYLRAFRARNQYRIVSGSSYLADLMPEARLSWESDWRANQDGIDSHL